MPTYFEQECSKFIEKIITDTVRREVAQQIEAAREPWVTVERAAELLSSTPRWVKRHIAAGWLVSSKPLGSRKPLVERASIDQLIAKHRESARDYASPFVAPPRFRGSHPLNDPEQVRRGKLGYERRRLQKQGLSADEVNEALWRQGLIDERPTPSGA